MLEVIYGTLGYILLFAIIFGWIIYMAELIVSIFVVIINLFKGVLR